MRFKIYIVRNDVEGLLASRVDKVAEFDQRVLLDAILEKLRPQFGVKVFLLTLDGEEPLELVPGTAGRPQPQPQSHAEAHLQAHTEEEKV